MNLKYSATKHHHYPKYIVPVLFVIFFIGTVILILIAIYPGNSLTKIALSQNKASPIALYYLMQMSIKDPDNYTLRAALVNQQILSGKTEEAKKNLSKIENIPQIKNSVSILKFTFLLSQSWSSNKKGEKNTEFSEELEKNANHILTFKLPLEKFIALAEISLKYNKPDIALLFYLHVDTFKENNRPDWYLTIANTALQSSQYIVAYEYYIKAYEIERNIVLKRKYVQFALKALMSGNMHKKGFSLIEKLPPEVINNSDFLFFLSQYALSGNKPEMAAKFVKRAIALEENTE